jgi:signal recognition particle receptor subunit beta
MVLPDPIDWTIYGLSKGWENREAISRGWSSISAWLTTRNTSIAMTGLSGSGKSTLLDEFTGKTSKTNYALPSASLQTDIGLLKNKVDRRAQILAVPGENAAARQSSIQDVFYGKRPLAGVIHVVCNGYSSIRELAAKRTFIAAGIHTPSDLREQKLVEEVRDLKMISACVRQHYAKNKARLFFSVVVNKYDLFSDKPDSVREYYDIGGSSDFSEELQSLQKSIGSDNIQITCDPASAWPEHFCWNGHCVTSNLDRSAQTQLTSRYLQRLNELLRASEIM